MKELWKALCALQPRNEDEARVKQILAACLGVYLESTGQIEVPMPEQPPLPPNVICITPHNRAC